MIGQTKNRKPKLLIAFKEKIGIKLTASMVLAANSPSANIGAL
jgi:hypothetical protein